VVVAIPFTSIIEQTADVYRSALGTSAIIEHHSALDPIKEHAHNRVASENWDAPVVVTTNVQLFESLFASRPSACRKLHNLGRSVIVLDEAQAVPGRLLVPIIDVLSALVRDYGCSVVICTATQPAWRRSEVLPQGPDHITEICPPEMKLFRRLERVACHWPTPGAVTTYDEVAQWIVQEPSSLAIVHLRQDARLLCERVDALLGERTAVHLSALMTPEHRSTVLAGIREAQRQGRPVRVVATQLVEAGVDLDFPVVFRALGGLDAMTQAAGRCNREGRLQRGRLIVFDAETDPPIGIPTTGRDLARIMLASGAMPDLLDPTTLQRYFVELYQRTDLRRAEEIQLARRELNFATVARQVRLIEDGWSVPLVFGHGAAAELLASLRRDGPSRRVLRSLQRYTINVPRRFLMDWTSSGAVQAVTDTVHALEAAALAAYDDRLGLLPERVGYLDPETLVVG
jgi:CRISPR-associated endonuclease/helicase Cas3